MLDGLATGDVRNPGGRQTGLGTLGIPGQQAKYLLIVQVMFPRTKSGANEVGHVQVEWSMW